MAKKPLLSVVIPAYNEEALIAKCLDSIMKQDLDKKYFEVIVINNASTDKTSKIAKKYPVRLIEEKRRSVVIARQTGVNYSRGEIIVSADADTVYPKTWLGRIRDDFEKNPRLVALVGWIYFTGTTPFFNMSVGFNQELNLFISKYSKRFPLVFSANFAFKKKALSKIGGYPVHIPELGDQQYLLYRFFPLGDVQIDHKVYCFTSGRRHKHSAWKAVFLYNGWYKIVGYAVNKLSGKQIIGPAPAIRTIPSRKSRYGH